MVTKIEKAEEIFKECLDKMDDRTDVYVDELIWAGENDVQYFIDFARLKATRAMFSQGYKPGTISVGHRVDDLLDSINFLTFAVMTLRRTYQ